MAINNELKQTYFVKKEGGYWRDVTAITSGVRVLAVEGFFDKGEPVNIYTAQWVNSQTEDFLVAHEDNTVIRKNTDIKITFMVHQKFANTNATIDVATQHDAFVEYLTSGVIWVRSMYADKEVKCVCLEKYEPTTVKLKRNPSTSFMLGTITLHTLEQPTQI